MKTRLQSLGLLDRAIRATSDEELAAIVAGLGDDHREAVERLVGGGDGHADAIRAAVHKGRMNGTMESIAMVLTDASLADCIEKLGDHADNPTTEQLTEVLPGHRRASRSGGHAGDARLDRRRARPPRRS